MIHPAFQGIQDTSMANAFTEIFTQNFKFTATPEIAMRYEEGGFPPTPSHLTSITAAYLDTSAAGDIGIKRQFVGLQPDLANLDEVAQLYETNVRELQKKTGILAMIAVANAELHDGIGGIEGVQSWYIDKVGSNGGRLLAAHITARTIEDKQMIDAVAIPRPVFDELPLLARDTFSTLRPHIDDLVNSRITDGDEKQQINKVMKTFLCNDPVLENLGAVAASSLLPDAQQFASTLRIRQ